MILPYLIALGLSVTQCEHAHKRRAHVPCSTTGVATSKTSILERALRRRMVLTARLAYLERKQRRLEAFLVRATTEQPIFRDEGRINFGDVELGPTIVTRDFLGSAVIRAALRMHGGQAEELLVITARLKAADGLTAEATLALPAGIDRAPRTIELTCPQAITPVSIEWTVSRL